MLTEFICAFIVESMKDLFPPFNDSRIVSKNYQKFRFALFVLSIIFFCLGFILSILAMIGLLLFVILITFNVHYAIRVRHFEKQNIKKNKNT